MGINSRKNIERGHRNSSEGIFCERKDIARESESRLKAAFDRLDIPYPNLPKIEVRFIDTQDRPELGRTFVDAWSVQILFDSRFATQAQEGALVEKLKASGLEYPGMAQTLTHEAGHIALWSVLKVGHRPATRLLDEGWATLLEEAGSREDFAEDLKQRASEGFFSEPELFKRCLDFRRTISPEENLNGAEYVVGATLLLWIREVFGNQVMLDTIKATLDLLERNDSIEEDYSATSDDDARLEDALRKIFPTSGMDDIKREYLEWLRKQ